MTSPRATSLSRAATALRTAAVTALVSIAAVSCSAGHPSSGKPLSTAVAVPSSLPSTASGWTLIATIGKPVPRYAAPGGSQDGAVAARWYGAASALPVISERPGWLQVRLATRPNGSTAWIRRTASLRVTATPDRIVISLSARQLRLFRLGKLVMTAPAGIGTSQDPTPKGHFFVAFLEKAPSAGYGPFIVVTSAHSTAISDWKGSGDAVVGIHGPLGEDSAIGSAGARLSHGCVRLHDLDLARLRAVPAGTPITVTA